MCDAPLYARADELLAELRRTNEENKGSELPLVAAGIARSDGHSTVEELFERADKDMYSEKQRLKGV